MLFDLLHLNVVVERIDLAGAWTSPEDVAQVGLMISDQQAGPFRLQIKFIEAVTALPFCLDR